MDSVTDSWGTDLQVALLGNDEGPRVREIRNDLVQQDLHSAFFKAKSMILLV